MDDKEKQRRAFIRKLGVFNDPRMTREQAEEALPPDNVVAMDRKTKEPILSKDLTSEERGLSAGVSRGMQQGMADTLAMGGATFTGAAPTAMSLLFGALNTMREPGRGSGARTQMGAEGGNILFNLLNGRVPAPLRGMTGQIVSAIAGGTAEQGLESMFGSVSGGEALENIENELLLPAAFGTALGGIVSGARQTERLREAFGNISNQQINNLGLAANLKSSIGRTANRLFAGAFLGFKNRRDHIMTAAALKKFQDMGFIGDTPMTISDAVARSGRTSKPPRSVQSSLQSMAKKAEAFSELVQQKAREGTNLVPQTETGKVRLLRDSRGRLHSFQDGTPVPKGSTTVEIFPEAFAQAKTFLKEIILDPDEFAKAVGKGTEGRISKDALEVIQAIASPEESMALANAYMRHHFIGPALPGNRAQLREAVRLAQKTRQVAEQQPGFINRLTSIGQPTEEIADAVVLDAARLNKSLDSKNLDETRAILALGGGKVGQHRLDAAQKLAAVLDENSIGAGESGRLGHIISYLGNKVTWQLGFGGLAGAGVLGPEIAAGATIVGGVGTFLGATLNSPVVMSAIDGAARDPNVAARMFRQLIQSGEYEFVPSPDRENEVLFVPTDKEETDTRSPRPPHLEEFIRQRFPRSN